MSKALPTRALATTLLALVSVAAQAQAQNDHAAHGQADAQTAAPSTQTVAPAADPHAGQREPVRVGVGCHLEELAHDDVVPRIADALDSRTMALDMTISGVEERIAEAMDARASSLSLAAAGVGQRAARAFGMQLGHGFVRCLAGGVLINACDAGLQRRAHGLAFAAASATAASATKLWANSHTGLSTNLPSTVIAPKPCCSTCCNTRWAHSNSA